MRKSYVFIVVFNKHQIVVFCIGYYTCTRNGKVADTELFEQGKYIECTTVNAGKNMREILIIYINYCCFYK